MVLRNHFSDFSIQKKDPTQILETFFDVFLEGGLFFLTRETAKNNKNSDFFGGQVAFLCLGFLI